MFVLPSGDSALIEPPRYRDLAMSHNFFGLKMFRNSAIGDISTFDGIGTAMPGSTIWRIHRSARKINRHYRDWRFDGVSYIINIMFYLMTEVEAIKR